jgi:hypothetical protein
VCFELLILLLTIYLRAIQVSGYIALGVAQLPKGTQGLV